MTSGAYNRLSGYPEEEQRMSGPAQTPGGTPPSAARGGASGRPPRRRRSPPRPVKVASVTRLTPRLVSTRLAGESLEGFGIEAPTSHIKVFLPGAGQRTLPSPTIGPDGWAWPDDGPQPVVRTYTPRRFDPATRTLEVQWVLHGPGPASSWAEHASVGDELAIAGPGGRFRLDPAAARWWIAGDESAIPAVATLLEELPPTASAEVHLEVDGAEDEIPLPGPAGTVVTWHHRRGQDGWGSSLLKAAQDAVLPDGTAVWVACEASAVRRVRKYLLEERQVPATSVVTRGYWRVGESNHPDHDYGED